MHLLRFSLSISLFGIAVNVCLRLILYVDDMLIAGSNQAKIGKLKRNLHDKFAMKERRQAQHILRYADRAKSHNEDPPALLVRLHTKGVEVLDNMEDVKRASTPLPRSI